MASQPTPIPRYGSVISPDATNQSALQRVCCQLTVRGCNSRDVVNADVLGWVYTVRKVCHSSYIKTRFQLLGFPSSI